jgi:hypothetical protein
MPTSLTSGRLVLLLLLGPAGVLGAVPLLAAPQSSQTVGAGGKEGARGRGGEGKGGGCVSGQQGASGMDFVWQCKLAM